MVTVTSQELRDQTDAILARVEAGDSIMITVDGRPVASLEPVDRSAPDGFERQARPTPPGCAG